MIPLQQLVLRQLAVLGNSGVPMSLDEAVSRGTGAMTRDRLRGLARGVMTEVLTAAEAADLAVILDVAADEVEAATTVLPPT